MTNVTSSSPSSGSAWRTLHEILTNFDSNWTVKWEKWGLTSDSGLADIDLAADFEEHVAEESATLTAKEEKEGDA